MPQAGAWAGCGSPSRRCSCWPAGPSSGARRPSTRSPSTSRRPGRYVAVGGALVVLATAGRLHLLGGTPPASASEAELRDAAGLLGVGVGDAAAQRARHRRRRRRPGDRWRWWASSCSPARRSRWPPTARSPGSSRSPRWSAPRLGKLFLLPDPDGEPGGDAPYARLDDLDEHDTIELSPMPRGKRARKALNDDTLEDVLADGRPDTADGTAEGAGADGPGEGADATAAARRRPRPKIVVPEPDEAPPEQIELALGAAARASAWKLPPVTLLERTGVAAGRPQGGRGDRPHAREGAGRARRRDPAGRHGRRPHRHPLRARAGARGQGQPGHQPAQGHRLRDGHARRPHPGADPGQAGHRRRGAQRAPPDRGRWATSSSARRPARPPTRSRWRWAATSTAARC